MMSPTVSNLWITFLKTKVDYFRTVTQQKILFDDKMKTVFEEEIKSGRIFLFLYFGLQLSSPLKPILLPPPYLPLTLILLLQSFLSDFLSIKDNFMILSLSFAHFFIITNWTHKFRKKLQGLSSGTSFKPVLLVIEPDW